MKILFDPAQPFQADAIRAVDDLFGDSARRAELSNGRPMRSRAICWWSWARETGSI